MDAGTVLMGRDLLGAWIEFQSQIPLNVHYNKLGHGEDHEVRPTNLWQVVAGDVCGGGEVPGGSVKRLLGYWLRYLLH